MTKNRYIFLLTPKWLYIVLFVLLLCALYVKYTTSNNPTNLKVEVSGQASNKGEKTEDGDEEKLEPVGVKAEDEVVALDVATDGGDVFLGLGGAGKEHGDGGALLALEFGEAVLVDVLSGDAAEGLGLAGLGGLGVEGGVALDLLGGVGEVGDGEVLGRGLVAAAGDISETDLLSSITEGGVSLGFGGGGLLLIRDTSGSVDVKVKREKMICEKKVEESEGEGAKKRCVMC